MILEPWKSAEEIERRLSALTDPELAELLRTANRDLFGDESESYTSQSAPYWKRRIGFMVLAGLLAMSAGYASVLLSTHPSPQTKPHVAGAVPARQHPKVAVHHTTFKHNVAAVVHRTLVAPVHVVPAHVASMPVAPVRVAPMHPLSPAPDETLIRQARAQLLHERMLAARARADATRAEQQAKVAMQQQAEAQAWAQAEALAQARAEARAQEAQAQAEAQRAADLRYEEQMAQNSQARDIKTPDTPPMNVGRVPNPMSGEGVPSTGPVPGPGLPGPIGGNCTPHRGSFFGAMLDQVRVGGTSVGGVLRIVHP